MRRVWDQMGKIAGGALFALCLLLLFGVRVLAAPENLAGQEVIIDGITYEFAEGASYDMDEAVIACVTEISPDLEGEVSPESGNLAAFQIILWVIEN